MRILWLVLGLSAVALGVVGIFLPLLPTTPFMILAAAAFAKSSDRLHNWLMQHRLFGPMIRDWRDHGAIPWRTKRLAVGTMLAALLLSVALGVSGRIIAVQAVVLVVMGSWLVTRPSGPKPPLAPDAAEEPPQPHQPGPGPGPEA